MPKLWGVDLTKLKPKGPGAGRPTKYKKEFCQAVVDHLSKGYSFETFAPAIGVSVKSTYNWLKHEEFLQAKKEGEAHGRLFWERLGIGGVTGKIPGFNVTCWIFNMKNRFAWRDKVETSGEITVKPYIIKRPSGEEVELGVQKVNASEEES